MSNKNIDHLFQEKLKSFEELPDENVWNAIETSLDKKKKKRIIPIWWRLGGVAAILAILFFSLYPFDTPHSGDAVITDTENSNNTTSPSEEVQKKIHPEPLQEEAGVVHSNKEGTTEDISKSDPAKNRVLPSYASTKDKETTQGNKETHKGTNNAALAHQENSTPISSPSVEVNPIPSKNGQSDSFSKNNDNAIVNATPPVTKNGNISKDKDQTNLNPLPKEGATMEAVAEIEEDKKMEKDKKSIFDVIAEEEEEIVAEESSRKWAVSPSVAPIYFDSFGDGSPIDPSFSPNSKSGNVNLSYGLSVSYNVSKKISVRTGVHRVDYGYNTNDIAFSSSLATSRGGNLNNIDLAPNSKNIVLRSAVPGSEANIEPLQNNTSSDVSQAFDPSLNGRIVQQLGYLEVPLEVNYALVDNKWGVNVIGGLSSLFLIDNAISLESNGLITEIGKANNINMVNFSTNIGLGVHYKFSPKIQWNVEPIFKYQLNTFSGATGNFQPFSLGVYSGVSFKF